MVEHRVSMLRSALRRRVDPAHSPDPRVRALVAQLADLPIAPAPDPQFRADLRAQLVAITPRLIAEGATKPAPATGAAAVATHARAAARRRARLGRVLTITASVVTVLALLLGGAVWMSRKSLPGDNLYGLKRASEQFQLATASDDREKAQDYLHFAATRADEVRLLWARSSTTAMGSGPIAAGRVSAETASLIVAALRSSDSDVKSGTRLLTAQAVAHRSTSPLGIITGWAPGQLARLRALAAAMPAGPLRTHAASSTQLVAAAQQRAEALGAKVHCTCLSGAASDDLGPVPCTRCVKTATPVPGQATSGTSTSPGSGSGPASGTGTRTERSPAIPSRTPAVRTRTASGSSPPSIGPGLPTLPVKIPTSLKPSVPGVSVGKCGISASVGGIGGGLGLCTPGVHISVGR